MFTWNICAHERYSLFTCPSLFRDLVKTYFFTYWHLFKQFWFRLWTCHGNILGNYPHWKDRLCFFSSTAKDVLKPAFWLPFPSPSNLILLEQRVRASLKAVVSVTRINRQEEGSSWSLLICLFTQTTLPGGCLYTQQDGWCHTQKVSSRENWRNTKYSVAHLLIFFNFYWNIVD